MGKDPLAAEHTAELVEETAQVAILDKVVEKLGSVNILDKRVVLYMSNRVTMGQDDSMMLQRDTLPMQVLNKLMDWIMDGKLKMGKS